VRFLQSVGATLAGFVFNRADPRDRAMLSQSGVVSGRSVSRSAGRSKRGSSKADGSPTDHRQSRRKRPDRIDPVTGAVLDSAPAYTHGSGEDHGTDQTDDQR
jgi:hypothetical protein